MSTTTIFNYLLIVICHSLVCVLGNKWKNIYVSPVKFLFKWVVFG